MCHLDYINKFLDVKPLSQTQKDHFLIRLSSLDHLQRFPRILAYALEIAKIIELETATIYKSYNDYIDFRFTLKGDEKSLKDFLKEYDRTLYLEKTPSHNKIDIEFEVGF